MGRRDWFLAVVGVTAAALDALAAARFFNLKDLKLRRAHLVSRIEFVRHLMRLPQPASYEDFASHWTANDRTVLALSSENRPGGFSEYLPFDAPPGMFSSAQLVGWGHGKAERDFLKGVHSQRPTPVEPDFTRSPADPWRYT